MHTPVYQQLATLYERLEHYPVANLSQQIQLAETCINAEHHSGKIWGLDIARLRLEVEALV